jgi:lipopolysaccharide biosynthesis regulator YciM
MTRLTVGVATLFLVLAGCGGDGDDAGTSSAETEWADSVCRAADDVSSSLSGLTDAIDVDSGSSVGEAMDQIQSDLSDRADAVQQSVADLSDVVTELPTDVDAAINSAEEDLSSDAEALSSSVESLSGAVSKAADAGDAEEFTTALTESSAELAATQDALGTLADDIEGYAQSSEEAVRQAFEEAPSCQA